ncbi:MAG: hypothetical protein KC503_01520 [Myxococcales bacterium]|nr:hypothetical protein [Myxococcales bacterium]
MDQLLRVARGARWIGLIAFAGSVVSCAAASESFGARSVIGSAVLITIGLVAVFIWAITSSYAKTRLVAECFDGQIGERDVAVLAVLTRGRSLGSLRRELAEAELSGSVSHSRFELSYSTRQTLPLEQTAERVTSLLDVLGKDRAAKLSWRDARDAGCAIEIDSEHCAIEIACADDTPDWPVVDSALAALLQRAAKRAPASHIEALVLGQEHRLASLEIDASEVSGVNVESVEPRQLLDALGLERHHAA